MSLPSQRDKIIQPSGCPPCGLPWVDHLKIPTPTGLYRRMIFKICGHCRGDSRRVSGFNVRLDKPLLSGDMFLKE